MARFLNKNRIRKKKDFLIFRREGKKWPARHWILYYRLNGLDFPRLATTISTRYGSAVRRNRLRRWIREQFRTNMLALSSLDLHFVAKATKKDNWQEYERELQEDFAKLLHKLAV